MDTKFEMEKRRIDLAVFDLDGTLINQDSLFEQVKALYKLSKFAFLDSFRHLFLKSRVSYKKLIFELNENFDNNSLSMMNIKLNKTVKKEFDNYKVNGIKIIIATAAYERTAVKVLKKIRLSPDVLIATKRKDNLKGKAKLFALTPYIKNKSWAYYGDSISDKWLFKSASLAYKVTGNSIKKVST